MQIPILILTLLAGLAPVVEEDRKDSGITERVDVQLVLLDVTVMDRKREIVMGLAKDDFILRVDHERVPIVSLDMACPDGPLPEPRAVEREANEPDWVAPDRDRRVVFAVDYRHIEPIRRIEVLHDIRAAIRRLHRSNEEMMIVALTDFLRVELPPTTDGDAAIAALDRMENDISLWLPSFDHLHDVATFDALYDLTLMLGALPDDKIVVMYSDWPSSGFNYDDAFKGLTRAAARNRVSFYTVWTRGLRGRGTSRNLARLAVETGGRFTERTNDFSLAYARAQRDTSCRYTLGFHDTPEDPDRTRTVDVRVTRRGIQPYYHDRYAPADDEEAPGEIARATLAWPELHESSSVDVELVPLRPLSRRRWETVFAVAGFEPSVSDVHVRARLRRDNTRWTRTDEELKAPFSAAQPIKLRHGEYVSSIAALYPGEIEPRSATRRIELPELTDEKGWWHGEPLALRPLGGGSVDAAVLEGTALEDDPLDGRVPVLRRVGGGESLSLLQTVCRYGAFETANRVRVLATVHEGERLVFQADVEHSFPAGDGVQCERLDRPMPRLPPGSYLARVTLRQGDAESVREREFEVVP